MQISIFLSQAVDQPPTLSHLFLENPWPIFIALVGVAAVMRTIARRQDNPRLNQTALIAVVLALLLVVTATLVTTPREAVMRLSRQFIHATAADPPDAVVLDQVLDANTTLSGPDGSVWVPGKGRGGGKEEGGGVRQELEAALSRYPVDTQSVTIGAADVPAPGVARVVVHIRTTFLAQNLPIRQIPTTWLFTWERDAKGHWTLADLQWLEWANRQKPHNRMWR